MVKFFNSPVYLLVKPVARSARSALLLTSHRRSLTLDWEKRQASTSVIFLNKIHKITTCVKRRK